MSNMMQLFDAARRVSVPIVAIGTADQLATVEAIRKVSDSMPVVQWDAVRGITKVNLKGEQALTAAQITGDDTVGFADAMVAALRLPKTSVLLAHNAHRQLHAQEPLAVAANVQAVANTRDALKKNFRMLVLLGPDVTLPTELKQDVITLQHELPTPDELAVVVQELHVSAKLPAPSLEAMAKAQEATSGLSLFAAEQVTSMSLSEQGMDIDQMWESKRTAIEQTQGLSVWRGKERFADIVGLDAIKEHLLRQATGRLPLGCLVWIDEIDKVFGGGDGGGEHDTKRDQVKTMLTEMDNYEWRGCILVGVSGGGKSLVPKAFGNEAGVPTIALDLGGAESKWQGESEQNLRQIMKVIKAVGRGNAYFIATSNGASVMRPELQRRFTDGMWMFDLMTDAERAATWEFYLGKYGISNLAGQLAQLNDDGWTGAEIRNCCRYAWNAGCTLLEAERFVVPMSRSRADEIERLRKFAHGRLLDASRGGSYAYNEAPMAAQVRAISLPSSPAALDLSGLKGRN